MKKIIAIVVSIAFLTGCAGSIYRPKVDMTNVTQERYEKDIQHCKDIAGYSLEQMWIMALGVSLFPPLFFNWDNAANHNDPAYMNRCMKDKGYTIKEESNE